MAVCPQISQDTVAEIVGDKQMSNGLANESASVPRRFPSRGNTANNFASNSKLEAVTLATTKPCRLESCDLSRQPRFLTTGTVVAHSVAL